MQAQPCRELKQKTISGLRRPSDPLSEGWLLTNTTLHWGRHDSCQSSVDNRGGKAALLLWVWPVKPHIHTHRLHFFKANIKQQHPVMFQKPIERLTDYIILLGVKQVATLSKCTHFSTSVLWCTIVKRKANETWFPRYFAKTKKTEAKINVLSAEQAISQEL